MFGYKAIIKPRKRSSKRQSSNSKNFLEGFPRTIHQSEVQCTTELHHSFNMEPSVIEKLKDTTKNWHDLSRVITGIISETSTQISEKTRIDWKFVFWIKFKRKATKIKINAEQVHIK